MKLVDKTNSQGEFVKTGENSIYEIIKKFERDQVDYLYDVEPQSQNLFMVANFNEYGTGNDSLKEMFNAQFRIRSIKTPDWTFSMETDPLTRVPLLKESTFSYDVTIDWFEDVYHSVRMYHENWANRWYDRVFDTLRCGVSGKFRKLELLAYHYKTKDNNIFSDPVPEPIFVMKIGGMMPTSVPGMQFSYDNDGNDQMLSISYKCSSVELLYNKDFTTGDTAEKKKGADANLFDSTGKTDSEDKNGKDLPIWQATGIESNYGETGEKESLRIARSVTTRYDSMFT